MPIFTFHFTKTTLPTAISALCHPPTPQKIPGLHHAESLTQMTLGAQILSPKRMQFRHLTEFLPPEKPCRGNLANRRTSKKNLATLNSHPLP